MMVTSDREFQTIQKVANINVLLICDYPGRYPGSTSKDVWDQINC